jgi:hypothetical protein
MNELPAHGLTNTTNGFATLFSGAIALWAFNHVRFTEPR